MRPKRNSSSLAQLGRLCSEIRDLGAWVPAGAPGLSFGPGLPYRHPLPTCYRGRRRRRFQLHAASGVHEHEHHVAGFKGFVDLLQHAAVELRAGLVDAGRIDKDDLRGGICAFVRGDLDHAHDAIARGLRLGGDDGHLFAGEGVEERAFADVGPAENGDESGFQRVWFSCISIIADLTGRRVVDIISA